MQQRAAAALEQKRQAAARYGEERPAAAKARLESAHEQVRSIRGAVLPSHTCSVRSPMLSTDAAMRPAGCCSFTALCSAGS